MCHICKRLGIVIEQPTDEQLEKMAAEEEESERAWEQEQEAKVRELIDKGLPLGKAPRKMLGTHRSKLVVEPAPSHDGAPTFAAYEVSVKGRQVGASPRFVFDEDFISSTCPPSEDPQKHRAKIGIRIYDTTANATADRAALLAQRIQELTYKRRYSDRYHQKDRIEVVALPMPASTTADERAVRCIEHNEAERAARLPIADAAVAASWLIVESDYDYSNCRKRLFVIHDLKDSWEEALREADAQGWNSEWLSPRDQQAWAVHGCFLSVGYDRDWSVQDSEDEDKEREREFIVREFCLEMLGDKLDQFRQSVWGLYELHAIPEGVLDIEMALARAAAAGEEVPRPVVIPYPRIKTGIFGDSE